MPRGTRLRSIRIPDEVWIPAQEATEREGDTISDVVRQALITYTEQHPPTTEGTAS